jgi:CDP-4-dehydro-6-deoxyglucose reductase
MNLQFHIPATAGNPFIEALAQSCKANDTLSIKGPQGDFTLNEDSPRSLVFIAVNAGFGPVKSLIEHAMALDTAENIQLYWITTPDNSHYLGNLCRSWDDALDNFAFTALQVTESDGVKSLLPGIVADLSNIADLDVYACTPAPLLEPLRQLLTDNGVVTAQLRMEPLRETATAD